MLRPDVELPAFSRASVALLRRFVARLVAFFRPARVERELTRELTAHLALLEDDYRARGMSPAQARAAARRALGGVERTKEAYRDQRSFPWLEDLRRDVPYAIRGLRRHPGFTLTAVLTVALGVGATTAVFSIVHAILLRPLPYADSDRLVQIAENVTTEGPGGVRHSRRFGLTQAEFLEWRARTTTLSHVAGVMNLMSGTVLTAEGTVPAPRAIVSPVLFEMLGVQARLGRTLIADDERPDADAAVISAAAWQRFFGGDPAVLGRSVTLNNTAFTIVGVMPAGFDYPERSTMFWTALAPRPNAETRPFGHAVGKLRPDVSIRAAIDEANVIGMAVRSAPPRTGFGAGAPPPPPATPTLGGPPRVDPNAASRPRFEVLRIKDLIVEPIRPSLRLLATAVAIVLLIVCANVANLLLARSAARQREIGVRLAIGAGRGRIVRQLITESLVLAAAGGIGGLFIAAAGVRMVTKLGTIDVPRLFQLSIGLGDGSLLPRVTELGVDPALLVTATLAALVTGVAFGSAPAYYTSRVSASRAMRVRTWSQSGSASPRGVLRDALVVAQVSMATTLLVAAGLLAHSFVRLLTVDVGYDSQNLLTAQLGMRAQSTGEEQLAAVERVIDRLRQDARVASVGYTNIPPFLAISEYRGLVVPRGFTREAVLEDALRPQTRLVSHEYLQTIGSRLLEGRWLTAGDGAAQPLVFVVNRALARRYFGGDSPVGTSVQVFHSPDDVETWQIVGVVDDVVQARLDQEPFPIVYADLRQVLSARARLPESLRTGQPLSGFPTIVARTRGAWQPVAGELRAIVRAVDPSLSVDTIADVESLRHGSLVRPRFYAVLLGIFAAMAGVLAALGIYGVLAYTVVQRTHEIGVRMALGARHGTVLASVLGRGIRLTVAGVAIGLAGAAGLTRYLSSMLFGLTPFDLTTYAVVALAFVSVGALACYVPARRATKVDPLVALRCE